MDSLFQLLESQNAWDRFVRHFIGVFGTILIVASLIAFVYSVYTN